MAKGPQNESEPGSASWAEVEDLARFVRDHFAPESRASHESPGLRELLERARQRVERAASRQVPYERYDVREELARGGMGRILRAFDRDLGREVAMKVMHQPKPSASPTDSATSTRLARFVNEARVMALLDHPGVVSVHEIGLDEQGETYLTMNLVRGRTLGDVLDSVRSGDDAWTVARVVGHLMRVCETVAYAHTKGIVHRDLKPANIMIGRFGETYVMDWGLAKVTGVEDFLEEAAAWAGEEESSSPVMTADGCAVGTPISMAPEQARGLGAEVGPRSDVYAIGALLYELLAGRSPYADQRVAMETPELVHHVAHHPPDPIDDVAPDAPLGLRSIVRKAMARDPEKRYASAQALSDDLRRHQEGRVVSVHRTGVWIELRAWARRNRGLAAALMALLACVLTAVGALGWQEFDKSRSLRAKSDEMEGYSDSLLIRELLAESDALWPRRAETLEPANDWTDRAAQLLARRAQHRDRRARLGESPLSQRAASAEGQDAKTRWRRQTLDALDEEMQRLADRVVDVQSRCRFVDQLSALQDEAAELWEDAITDVFLDERFETFELVPEPGLIPWGCDEESGLWQFWHPGTGERPDADEHGRPVIGDDTALVFVLVPGGETTLGAQSTDSTKPYFDPLARWDEPLRQVTLQPYYLSRYEMTQGQWLRAVGSRPSEAHVLRKPLGPRYPVYYVGWQVAMDAVARLGLELPTEAQWEHALRAGKSTAWFSGQDMKSLKGSGNLADRVFQSEFGPAIDAERWTDGHGEHAPVGCFVPNDFGFHDFIGNVMEWTRDRFVSDAITLRDGDGAVLSGTSEGNGEQRCIKGASFHNHAFFARSSARMYENPDFSGDLVGLRPALTARGESPE